MEENNKKVLPEQPCDTKLVARNQSATQMILAWLADDSGYDETVWPTLQKLIEENRLSNRPRFGEDHSSQETE